MKRPAATAFFVMILLMVAFALGVANKIRTNRRAREAAESLNRSVPPNRAGIPEGPIVISTPDLGPSTVNKQKTTPRVRRPSSIELEELRTAVLAGDYVGVRRCWRNVEPEDAVAIHSLLSKIPSTADEETRWWIKAHLVHLLTLAKGDEGSRLLLAVVMQEGLLSDDESCAPIRELGNRRYSPARTYLDGIAFGDAKGDLFSSTCALIQIEPCHYLPRTGKAIATSEGEKLWDYVAALERSAVSNDIDIAAALPDLKAKFLDASTPWGYRTRIARTLERYSRQWNSTATRVWLTDQLNRIVALPRAQSPPAWDVSICRELLDLMRESVNSDSK